MMSHAPLMKHQEALPEVDASGPVGPLNLIPIVVELVELLFETASP